MKERSSPRGSAVEELRSAGEELEAVARREGIEANGPLGVFVRALMEVIRRLGEIVVFAEKSLSVKVDALSGKVDVFEKAGEAELVKLREMLSGAAILASQLRHMSLVIDVERDKALARVVEGIGPEIIVRLKPWMQLRETEWNRSQKWRRGQRTAVLAILLLGMGYGFRAWQDAEATSALARCVSARVASAVDGHLVCDVTNLLPRAE